MKDKAPLNEFERVAMFYERNYTWPPTLASFNPPTTGWARLFRSRLSSIAHVANISDRYNGYLSAVTSAFVVPNFTSTGFHLTKAPPSLFAELRASLLGAIQNNRTRPECQNEIIEIENLSPLFVDQPILNAKALIELLPLHEEFASVSLTPEIAYGLRIYRNGSSLLMHTDKLNTHIIASILHIDNVGEPWPISIESFDGVRTEIIMEPGDLLLYEAAKCYHGRPTVFNGTFYCSLFSHYSPVGWDRENAHLEAHYAVPPDWFDDPDPVYVEPINVIGSAIKERI